MVKANATFTHSSGKWSLNAYIKNVTEVATKSMYGMCGMTIADPRTFVAVFSVRF